jgi:soluble lytic murein transglycosylase-like protein
MSTPAFPTLTFQTTIDPNDPAMLAQSAAANAFRKSIEAAAQQFGLQPAVVCGLGSRESGWGLLLKPRGPAGTGDFAPRRPMPPLRPGPLPPDGLGFGRGLLQIDFDSNPLAQTGNWRDPQTNIMAGCRLLANKFKFLMSNLTLDYPVLQRGAIAAYNCGEGAVCKVLQAGLDVDSRTAGRNYSADVLNRAGFFQLHGWQ